MGSRSSKASEIVTPSPMTTTTVPSTIPSQTTTISHFTEDCRCQVEMVLAFFGGILVALLICAIVYCVIKIKSKVKRRSGLSRYKSQEKESSNGVGVRHLETVDENVSYASLRFLKT